VNHREHSEVDDKPQKSLNEKQQENQELLIRCVAQHLGFAGNRPIAACIIYKCLLQWRSFEVERTSVFDRIIQTIGHAIEVWNSKSWALKFLFITILFHHKSPLFTSCFNLNIRPRITMIAWPIGYPMPQHFSYCFNVHWKQVVQQEWLHSADDHHQLLYLEEWHRYAQFWLKSPKANRKIYFLY